jgi:hypothetical protein
MPLTKLDIDELLGMLEATPDFIQSLVKGVSVKALSIKPDEATWSINEILAHLRACSDVWGKDIQRMLNENHPTMRYISPRTYMKKTGYEKLPFETSFEAYCLQRERLLQTLRKLSIASWGKQGTFTGTTRGKHQTVFSYAKRIADHEHHHFVQFNRVLQELKKDTIE